MYPDLQGKIALITGGGKRTGIGFGIVNNLAAAGADVVIADLGTIRDIDNQIQTGTAEEMASIVEEIEDRYAVRAMAIELDVTQTASVEHMAARVAEAFAGVDILCNGAGAAIGVPNTIHAYEETAWLKTIDINLNGVFRVVKAVVPMMTGRSGSIINVASKAGKSPPLFNGAYATAKAGVIMLTKVMARELAEAGIRVNAVCPGVIQTDMTQWRFALEAQFFSTTVEARQEAMCQQIPLARLGTIDEVANLVTFLASNASSYMTGQAINVTGGQLTEI
jgi:NAD(P)-dependent dehydrogenase (short-subunit alcohol dehydrogenase family)